MTAKGSRDRSALTGDAAIEPETPTGEPRPADALVAAPKRAQYLVLGGVCGLTWAAGMRGWMEQLALGSGSGSQFTWLTVALVLLPGATVGSLFGWALHGRVVGQRAPRALVWSPVLFASAIADPTIFHELITTGEGGGSLLVVITALSTGYAVSGPRWNLRRVMTGLLSAAGLLLIAGIANLAAPLVTPRGAWVSLLGFCLVLVLGLASSLTYPRVRPLLGVGWFVIGGALLGLAWAASLRAFMADLAGADSVVHWFDTFGLILLPGLGAGAVLGWAEHLRRVGGRPKWRWLVLSPCAFLAVVVNGLLAVPSQVDPSPVVVVLVAITGGYALAGRGKRWSRALAGTAVICAFLVPLVIAVTITHTFPVDSAHAIWVLCLIGGLLTLLALATSIPLREPLDAATSGQSWPDVASASTASRHA